MTNTPPDRIWAWPDCVEDGFMAACNVGEPPPPEPMANSDPKGADSTRGGRVNEAVSNANSWR